MNKIGVAYIITVALAVVLTLPAVAHAQSAETLYKAKCAGCHAADGTGSPIGKRMGAHDFQTAEVQKMSDASSPTSSPTARIRCPQYGKSLKPEDIKGLVAFIRTLKK